LSLAFSIRWKLNPGLAGFIWRSKAAVLTAFCSSPVNRARLSVNVSAIRRRCVQNDLDVSDAHSPGPRQPCLRSITHVQVVLNTNSTAPPGRIAVLGAVRAPSKSSGGENRGLPSFESAFSRPERLTSAHHPALGELVGGRDNAFASIPLPHPPSGSPVCVRALEGWVLPWITILVQRPVLPCFKRASQATPANSLRAQPVEIGLLGAARRERPQVRLPSDLVRTSFLPRPVQGRCKAARRAGVERQCSGSATAQVRRNSEGHSPLLGKENNRQPIPRNSRAARPGTGSGASHAHCLFPRRSQPSAGPARW
jgi:hypothetical protein